MKKSSMYTAIGVVGVALGVRAVQSYLKDNKKEESNSYFLNAGMPDQSPTVTDTQLDNAKMVSEGSSYGVHYFNQHNENE